MSETLRLLTLALVVLFLYQVRARPRSAELAPPPLAVGASGERDELSDEGQAEGESPWDARGEAGLLGRERDPPLLIGRADLTPLGAARARGDVMFAASSDGHLIVTARVENAKSGAHALFVHDERACPKRRARKAGWPRLAPLRDHEAFALASSRLGDFGDVLAGAQGEGLLEVQLEAGGQRDGNGPPSWDWLEGHIVVLYEQGGHFSARHEGSPGAPIACGVINDRLDGVER